MAQHDYVIDNSTGANVRADINSVLQAIATNNSPVGSGHTNPPSTTFATSWFADIDAGIMKLRNTANTDYVNLFTLAGGVDVDAASNFNEDVTFQCASGTIVFDKSANDLTFSDSVKARFGDSNDLSIFHDGSNSHIEDAGTGGLLIKGDSVNIGSTSGEFYFRAFEDGASSLRFDNSQKLVTTTDGIQVTGEVVSGTIHCSGKLDMPDSSGATVGRVLLGDSDDLQLYHDGSHSYIARPSGADGQLLIRALDSENSIVISNNGGVELYFDNSKKFFTNNLGVTVESTGNTPTLEFRGASALDLGKIDVDQFSSNFSMMRFSTLSSGTITERMRILDNGSVLIGTTSQGGPGGATILPNNSQGAATLLFDRSNTSNTSTVLNFENNNSTVGSITHGNSSTAYNTSSDYRLKENATAISDGITRLKTLKPYRFNFKIDADKIVDGFFAHEVTAVPEAVTGTKDEVDSDNNPVYQGIDQSKLVPLLVAAVQELIGKVEALEAA